MRRVRGLILSGLTVLSLIVVIIAIALWVRSAFAGYQVSYRTFRPTTTTTAQGTWIMGESSSGRLRVEWHKTAYVDVTSPGLTTGWGPPNPGSLSMGTYSSRTPPSLTDPTRFDVFGLSLAWGSFTTTTRDTVRTRAGAGLIVPYWQVILGGSIVVVACEGRRRSRRRRLRETTCPTCGYDLRATPDRCPECGLLINRAEAA